MLVPYETQKLAKLTNTDYKTVEFAMKLFKRIGLVEILENGEIYMKQVEDMVGGETDKAALMRRKRKQEKISGNNVTEALPKRYTEIEKEQEQEKDKDIYKDSDIYLIFDFWNHQEIIKHKKMNQQMKSHIKARLEEYSLDELKQATSNYKQILENDKYYW